MFLFHDFKICCLSILSDVINVIQPQSFTSDISQSFCYNLIDNLVYFSSISEVRVCKVTDMWEFKHCSQLRRFMESETFAVKKHLYGSGNSSSSFLICHFLYSGAELAVCLIPYTLAVKFTVLSAADLLLLQQPASQKRQLNLEMSLMWTLTTFRPGEV